MNNVIKTITLLMSGIIYSVSLNASAALERSPSMADARVYIISPVNGEVVPSSFKVQFGLTGMGVAPAAIDRAGTGHHHLIVNGNIDAIPKDQPIGNQAIHFGGGQTETTLTLPKGEHTLQLLLADQFHVPHNPVIHSEVVRITVK